MWVVHLIFSYNIGGTENMLLDITREQAKKSGVKVLLIVVNNDYDLTLIASVSRRVRVCRINRKPGSKRFNNLLAVVRLNAMLLYYRPVVIHCHNQKLIDLLIFNSLKNKAVFTAHTMGLAYSLIRKYRKCFAISKGVRMDILRQGALPVEVIYNGVQVEAIERVDHMAQKHPGALSGEEPGKAPGNEPEVYEQQSDKANLDEPVLALPGASFNIVQIGRLYHQHKGQDLLLYAVSALKTAGHKNITIDFFGDGASRGLLEALSQKLGLAANVRFLGSVPRSEIYHLLHGYDLLVQPSYCEGFGLSIVEAMMAEVPVLISDLAGPMEIIAQGKYGFHFKVGDMDDFKEKIAWLVTHYQEAKIKNMLRAAVRYAEINFDIRQTAHHYLESYRSL